ncbi:MAG: polyprenyl synthetase family protein [Bacteroidales bacterium]
MEDEITIKESIREEMARFNSAIVNSLGTDNRLLEKVVNYFLKSKGKQIRPILVILSAKIFGAINDSTLNAAVAVELLHNASLIHDDVVDGSLLRRGRKSISGVWDNRIAVLVGDYFVSCALKSAILSGSSDVTDAIANLGKELAKGEIDQIETANGHIIDEERYFRVIKQKTASLFASCMRMGGLTNGASADELDILYSFGEKLGLCFQIRDDIFDYFEDDKVGKPTGSDLKEGKISLPLIYAVKNGTGEINDRMRALLSGNSLSDDEIAELITYAKEQGGISYAISVMERLKSDANSILLYFGDSPMINPLRDILHFITVRSY